MTPEAKKQLVTQVEERLTNDRQTRDSDFVLVNSVCKRYFYNPAKYMLPIKFIRDIFTKKDMYLPDDLEVAKKRGISRNRWAKWHGYKMDENGAMIFFDKSKE